MTTKDDKSPLLMWHDMPASLGLLSRLPISVDTERATTRGAAAAWAYPLAGLVLGLIACAVGQIALWLGLSNSLTAGLILATLAIITGGMHEDGLSDCADGFWGGWDKLNRLKIMKDSHIGAFGVIALVFGIGLRWQAVTLILSGAFWPALLCVAILSRAIIVPVMAYIPHARTEGLSHTIGRPSPQTAWLAVGLAAIAAVILVQTIALILVIVAAVTALISVAIAKAKIDGQTGDVLGATQQLTEISVLLTLVILIV